ncbi:EAL domain-containing protein [Blastococcus saxobsidens]|uniref:PAS domain-containing protein n=1 Tax=Blastococcus saxobsidens (strain DD2) TaxID=1146883 RepID=H6RMP1_BLASD|nr:EAL domain-containing protein [Blastococcus saxobsidens]CCG03876.1 protein of unknown function [Blastococcus saxobsidens DD2]
MSVFISEPDDDRVPPEIVSSVFYCASVSDGFALVVAETVAGRVRVTWVNAGAVELLGYGLDDVRALPVDHLFPSLGGGELELLLRRERAARMTLPVRTASGAMVQSVVTTTPSPGGRMWTIRIVSATNEQERALRATADAHERRFSTLTERSPVPTLLSEQGMRLAHVNDAFCSLVGRRAEQLLGTGWIDTVHDEDIEAVIEQVSAWSFVAELAHGHTEIASAVIALARSLNLSTVAEGVETADQAAELARMGATYLQGFGLSQPMTGSRTAAWFASHGEPTP